MDKLENEIIRWGKLLFERRLISGWGGNLSCRQGSKNYLITGRHAALGFLTPQDLVRVQSNGKPVREDQRASSETPMHMAIYAGTDAQVIVHVHPPMVLAFSLTHDIFAPVSYEEKYTIGEAPIIAQDTPTVTQPEEVVAALKYHPVVIIKAHGTVAIGKNFQEAFLFTDLLEEAVRCQFYRERAEHGAAGSKNQRREQSAAAAAPPGEGFALFTPEHMQALVDSANRDKEFRAHGAATALTTSLTLHLEETNNAWTVRYSNGEITELVRGDGGEFMISGKTEWWDAVFRARIDPFLATQRGKLILKRGDLAELSRWYKPFQRAFTLWQRIPIQ
jgi:L-fuculose-phosphate aldolase